MRTITRTTNENAYQFIRAGENFRGSNFYGESMDSLDLANEARILSRHVLEEYRELFIEDMKEGGYFVTSYNSIIGWTNHLDGWRIPRYRYSNTTSRHQYHLRHAARWYDERPADEISTAARVKVYVDQGYPADAAATLVALEEYRGYAITV